MIEITLPNDVPQIKINSHVFDQQMSDLEIAKFADRVLGNFEVSRYSGMSGDERAAAIDELAGSIDKILGEGAVKIISAGHAVNMNRLVLWLAKISEAAANNYVEAATRD